MLGGPAATISLIAARVRIAMAFSIKALGQSAQRFDEPASPTVSVVSPLVDLHQMARVNLYTGSYPGPYANPHQEALRILRDSCSESASAFELPSSCFPMIERRMLLARVEGFPVEMAFDDWKATKLRVMERYMTQYLRLRDNDIVMGDVNRTATLHPATQALLLDYFCTRTMDKDTYLFSGFGTRWMHYDVLQHTIDMFKDALAASV